MSKTIQFKIEEEMKYVPSIVPASQALPQWYKDTPQDMPDSPAWTSGTYRTCLPFFDAMTQGYIIPLWADLYVSPGHIDGEPKPVFQWNQLSSRVTVTTHRPEQTKGMPAVEESTAGFAYKLLSPWVIETPKDYSLLCVPPLNNRDSRFEIVAGVVCTDGFVNPMNFPFIWNAPPDYEGFIKAGTPVAQIIPFKREVYEHECSYMTEKDRVAIKSVHNSIINQFRGGYKKFWRKTAISK